MHLLAGWQAGIGRASGSVSTMRVRCPALGFAHLNQRAALRRRGRAYLAGAAMRIAGAAPAACRVARYCARVHHVCARSSSNPASGANAAAFTIAVVSQGCKPANCAQTTATWQSIRCCPPKPSQRSKKFMPVLIITGSSPSAGTAALAGRAGSSSPRPANGIVQCDVRGAARYPRAVAAWLAVWCFVRLGKVSNLRRSGVGYWLQGRPLLL